MDHTHKTEDDRCIDSLFIARFDKYYLYYLRKTTEWKDDEHRGLTCDDGVPFVVKSTAEDLVRVSF